MFAVREELPVVQSPEPPEQRQVRDFLRSSHQWEEVTQLLGRTTQVEFMQSPQHCHISAGAKWCHFLIRQRL